MENFKKPNAIHEQKTEVKNEKPKVEVSKKANEEIYTVEKGDTLYSIGLKYGKTYLELAKYNDISTPHIIHVGDKIKIPK